MEHSFQILCLSASVLILLFSLHKLKQLFIVGTTSFSREVENGEGASCNFNSYIWDSKESAFNRYQKQIGSVELRKEFCFRRFDEIINNAKAEKAHLQEVK